jgi:hypothetical protein
MVVARSTVMIVTESALERVVFTAKFLAAGYRVAEAGSVEEAIRKAVRIRPRALLIEDHLLSLEVLQSFKTLPTLHTALVFVLMHAMEPAGVRGYLENGATNLFLRRANAPRDIVRVIHKALSI